MLPELEEQIKILNEHGWSTKWNKSGTTDALIITKGPIQYDLRYIPKMNGYFGYHKPTLSNEDQTIITDTLALLDRTVPYTRHQKMAEQTDYMAKKIQHLGRFDEVIHDGYHGIELHLWFLKDGFELKINQQTDFKYNIEIYGRYEMSSELWGMINELIKQLEQNCKEW